MLTAKKQIGFLVFLLLAFPGWSQTFRVTIAPSLQQENLDGRLLLLISKTNKTEPRFQINDAAGTQLVFGIDVDGWQPQSFAAGRHACFWLSAGETKRCACRGLLCPGAAA